MSVDLYVEQVVGRARLVVLRLLGGRSYWPYGLEQAVAACRAGGIPHAVLPGDDQPDPELQGWSSLPAETCRRLWHYLVHGGLDNAGQFLAYAGALLGSEESWREPAPLMRAGLYWPGLGQPDLAAVQRQWQPDRAVAALAFYRALVQAGDLEVIDCADRCARRSGPERLADFHREPQGPDRRARWSGTFCSAHGPWWC